jgi:hypothetical protein
VVADGVEGERQQIERGEEGGKVLLAVSEVVLEVIAAGLEGIERLVLDLPSGRPQAVSSATLSRLTGKSVMKLLR